MKSLYRNINVVPRIAVVVIYISLMNILCGCKIIDVNYYKPQLAYSGSRSYVYYYEYYSAVSIPEYKSSGRLKCLDINNSDNITITPGESRMYISPMYSVARYSHYCCYDKHVMAGGGNIMLYDPSTKSSISIYEYGANDYIGLYHNALSPMGSYIAFSINDQTRIRSAQYPYEDIGLPKDSEFISWSNDEDYILTNEISSQSGSIICIRKKQDKYRIAYETADISKSAYWAKEKGVLMSRKGNDIYKYNIACHSTSLIYSSSDCRISSNIAMSYDSNDIVFAEMNNDSRVQYLVIYEHSSGKIINRCRILGHNIENIYVMPRGYIVIQYSVDHNSSLEPFCINIFSPNGYGILHSIDNVSGISILWDHDTIAIGKRNTISLIKFNGSMHVEDIYSIE